MATLKFAASGDLALTTQDFATMFENGLWSTLKKLWEYLVMAIPPMVLGIGMIRSPESKAPPDYGRIEGTSTVICQRNRPFSVGESIDWLVGLDKSYGSEYL